MSTEQSGASGGESQAAVMRTFVRGRIASEPEFSRTMEGRGVGVCRLVVIGTAAGPASKPPRVSLYIRDGGGKLNPEEAKRCACGLHPGDVIQAVGALGPERAKARHQEVVVDEPVKLRVRGSGTEGAA